MGFLSSLFSNENRTRADMEKKLFILEDEKRGWTRGAKSSEKQILKDVFDIIEEVPETKKLLDDVAKQGYKFFFQRDTGKAEFDGDPDRNAKSDRRRQGRYRKIGSKQSINHQLFLRRKRHGRIGRKSV